MPQPVNVTFILKRVLADVVKALEKILDCPEGPYLPSQMSFVVRDKTHRDMEREAELGVIVA